MAAKTSFELRYPIGAFQYDPSLDLLKRDEHIDAITVLPGKLRKLMEFASEKDLNGRYRAHGWTVRQIVHHLADSHMNAFLRFKLALTEDQPAIKPYDQDAWVATPEMSRLDAEPSLRLLEGLHQRWATLLRALPEEAWKRSVFHPEHDRLMSLAELLAHYAWHGEHHLAHIQRALAI
jgi:uncharacterized damage-inducible protein DinB